MGERTTAATRVSESADSAAMLDPDYAMYLETCRLVVGKLCMLMCGKRAKVNTKV